MTAQEFTAWLDGFLSNKQTSLDAFDINMIKIKLKSVSPDINHYYTFNPNKSTEPIYSEPTFQPDPNTIIKIPTFIC